MPVIRTSLSPLKGIPALNISALAQQQRSAANHQASEESSSRRSDALLSPLVSGDIESESRVLERERTKISMIYQDKIFIGGEFVARDLSLMNSVGITHILNAAGDECMNFFPQQFEYLTLALEDNRLHCEALEAVLFDVITYIDEVLQGGGRVLVHCKEGVSRSCTHVIAYLMWKESMSLNQALKLVETRRPCCRPNTGFSVSLIKLGHTLTSAKSSTPQNEPQFNRLYRVQIHHPKAPFTVVAQVNTQETTPGEWHVNPVELDTRFIYILRVQLRRFYVWEGADVHPNAQTLVSSAVTRFFENMTKYELQPGATAEITHIRQGEEPSEFKNQLHQPSITQQKALDPEAHALATGAVFTLENWIQHLRSSKYQFNPSKIVSSASA